MRAHYTCLAWQQVLGDEEWCPHLTELELESDETAAPTCWVPCLCHFPFLESMVYVHGQVDFLIPNPGLYIGAVETSHVSKALIAALISGQEQSRARVLWGQAVKGRKVGRCIGHGPTSKWPSTTYSGSPYPAKGVKRLVYPAFVAPYTEGTIRIESREQVSPHHQRHMVGKFILAHNSLSSSHWDNSPLNLIGNERELGPKHISVSTHSSGKERI